MPAPQESVLTRDETPKTVASAQLLRATALGAAAFREGRESAPCLSKELLGMFTGRPVGEHPSNEASTVALMDAYSNAWMQAQRAEVDKGMALCAGAALLSAQDAADYLRNGRSWLALDALRQGAQSAPRPSDQSAFALLVDAVERWRPIMLNCKDGDPAGREKLAADVQKLHDDMTEWVDRTLAPVGQSPASAPEAPDDADELDEAESLEDAHFSGP